MESFHRTTDEDANQRPDKRRADDGESRPDSDSATDCSPHKHHKVNHKQEHSKIAVSEELRANSHMDDYNRSCFKPVTQQGCSRHMPTHQMKYPQTFRYPATPEENANSSRHQPLSSMLSQTVGPIQQNVSNMSYQGMNPVLCHQTSNMLPLLCPLTPPTSILTHPRTSPFLPHSSCTNRTITSTETINSMAQSVSASNAMQCFGNQQQLHSSGMTSQVPTMDGESMKTVSSSPRGHTADSFHQDLDGNASNTLTSSAATGSLVRQYLTGHSSPLPMPQRAVFATIPVSPGNDWASDFCSKQTVLCSPDGSRHVTSSPYRIVQAGIPQGRVKTLPLFSPAGSPPAHNSRVNLQQIQAQPLGLCIPNIVDQHQLVAVQAAGYGSPQPLVRSPVLRSPTVPTPANINNVPTTFNSQEKNTLDIHAEEQADRLPFHEAVERNVNVNTVGSSPNTHQPEQAPKRSESDDSVTATTSVVSSSSKPKAEDFRSSIVIDSDDDEDEQRDIKEQDLNRNITESIASIATSTNNEVDVENDADVTPDSPTDDDIKQIVIQNAYTINNQPTTHEPDSPSEGTEEHKDKPPIQPLDEKVHTSEPPAAEWNPSWKEFSPQAQCSIVNGMICEKLPSDDTFPTPSLPLPTTMPNAITPRTTISDTWKLRVGPSDKLPVLGGSRVHLPTTVPPSNPLLTSEKASRLGSGACTPDVGVAHTPASSTSSMSKWSVVDTQHYTGTPHPTLTGRYVVPSHGVPRVDTPHTNITSPLYTSTPVSQGTKQTLQYLCTPSSNGRSVSTVTLNSSGSEEGSSESSSTSDTQPPQTPKNTPVTPGGGAYRPPTVRQVQSALIPFKSRSTGNVHHTIPRQQSELELELGRSSHNLKERERRSRIKSACEKMRDLVPGITPKTDKATVFEYTAQYISFLKDIVGVQYDTVWKETATK